MMYVPGKIRKDGSKKCIVCGRWTILRRYSIDARRMIPVCARHVAGEGFESMT